jgi:hypothetical protein
LVEVILVDVVLLFMLFWLMVMVITKQFRVAKLVQTVVGSSKQSMNRLTGNVQLLLERLGVA